MTGITREYLDALDDRSALALNNPNGQQYDAAVLLASDLPAAVAALRRVLDLPRYNFGDLVAPSGVRYGTAYFIHAADLDAALEGTQTDDGAGSQTRGGATAPSSPDRIDEWARVLMAAWAKAEPDHGVTKHPASFVATFADMARALDAYDREHQRVVWDEYRALIKGTVEADLRERLAAEVEAAHRTAPDCCAYEAAARIVRGGK